MTRCPRVRIWQSLDRIDRSTLKESWATVARIPGTLFAAMATPMPVPHTRIDTQILHDFDTLVGLHVGQDRILVVESGAVATHQQADGLIAHDHLLSSGTSVEVERAGQGSRRGQ